MTKGRIVFNPLAASTLSCVGYAVVMLLLERRMHRTGGPGIIAFELAGSARSAEAIMAQWGAAGCRAARLSLWLDFGYMLTYGTLVAQLLDRTVRRSGHPRAVSSVVAGAVIGDAVEGISLLRVLDGTEVDRNARLARTAALTKFAVLAGSLGYVAAMAARCASASRRMRTTATG